MLKVLMETNEISVIRIQFSRPRSGQPGISGINPQSAFFSFISPRANGADGSDGDEAKKTKGELLCDARGAVHERAPRFKAASFSNVIPS